MCWFGHAELEGPREHLDVEGHVGSKIHNLEPIIIFTTNF